MLMETLNGNASPAARSFNDSESGPLEVRELPSSPRSSQANYLDIGVPDEVGANEFGISIEYEMPDEYEVPNEYEVPVRRHAGDAGGRPDSLMEDETASVVSTLKSRHSDTKVRWSLKGMAPEQELTAFVWQLQEIQFGRDRQSSLSGSKQ